MATENISKVYLLSVPLENDYKNTLYFNNKGEQESYFTSRILKSYTDFTYLRKDNVIHIPACYDDIYKANYVMYQNSNYSDKWFYAFIKEMKYENDECTILEIETDVMQTWMFDYNVKESFVEREHVSDDTIGKHTIPESLETGDYICNGKEYDENLLAMRIVMAYSDYANIKADVNGHMCHGIYTGMAYSSYPCNATGVERLNEMISEYDGDAKADAINSIFMAPVFISGSSADAGAMSLGPSYTAKDYDFSVTKLTSLNGYTPRNKKLLTYPYVYINASNNAGTNAIYKQELFSDSTCNFKVKGVLTPGCSIRATPRNYNGIAINNDEGINAGKYPVCCWNSDTYTNWLTQNSVNMGLSVASAGGNMIAGVLLASTGIGALTGAGMIANGLQEMGNVLAQKYQASLVPDQAKGNTNCGDVVTSSNENTFMYYKMSIKKEFAEKIDKYFDMFGYQVNHVKVPNKNHRSEYWFTKTIAVNIDGSIPANDMQKIKDCYNNGITFWVNPENVEDYSVSNTIV